MGCLGFFPDDLNPQLGIVVEIFSVVSGVTRFRLFFFFFNEKYILITSVTDVLHVQALLILQSSCGLHNSESICHVQYLKS